MKLRTKKTLNNMLILMLTKEKIKMVKILVLLYKVRHPKLKNLI